MTTIRTREAAGSRTAPPTGRGSATRRHILAVATNAFLAHGYAGTSLSDLIRAAGLTKGAFYHHFPSKGALAVEVVRARETEWAAWVVQASATHDRAVDQLRAMARLASNLKDQDHSASLQRLCAELCEDPELAPRIAGWCEAWIESVSGVVARAQLQGDIRAEVDAHQAAEVLVATFLGAEQQCAMSADQQDFRARVTRCLELLLELFKPAAARRG